MASLVEEEAPISGAPVEGEEVATAVKAATAAAAAADVVAASLDFTSYRPAHRSERMWMISEAKTASKRSPRADEAVRRDSHLATAAHQALTVQPRLSD